MDHLKRGLIVLPMCWALTTALPADEMSVLDRSAGTTIELAAGDQSVGTTIGLAVRAVFRTAPLAAQGCDVCREEYSSEWGVWRHIFDGMGVYMDFPHDYWIYELRCCQAHSWCDPGGGGSFHEGGNCPDFSAALHGMSATTSNMEVAEALSGVVSGLRWAYNVERGALQAYGCDDVVVGHFPMDASRVAMVLTSRLLKLQ